MSILRLSNWCSKRVRGFTRIELLVMLVTLGLLAGVTRPVWGNASAPRSLTCMDNLRRLATAWVLYADDHAGRFAANYQGSAAASPDVASGRVGWVSGWLDFALSHHNTNTLYLANSTYAVLAPYTEGQVSLYRCPADVYLSSVQVQRGWIARVRSYSMNCYMGEGNQETGLWDLSLTKYAKPSDFSGLSPRNAFVLTEEHPDSINDPTLFAPFSGRWVDLPASFHDGACWFTFADGHLEQRRWVSSTTVVPVRYSFISPPVRPGDPDLAWVSRHASERR
jgi:hypothetical protein